MSEISNIRPIELSRLSNQATRGDEAKPAASCGRPGGPRGMVSWPAARAFAGPISGLVYDIHEEADVTQYPLDPARVGGHDLRQESNSMDFREELKVLEQAKRDIGMIIMHLAHGEVQTASRGIETVIENLTEVGDEIRELKA